MNYPKAPDFKTVTSHIEEYARLQHEYGSRKVQAILDRTGRALQKALRDLKTLSPDARLAEKEPDTYSAILRLRPSGPRRIWSGFDGRVYRDKVEGALLGRMAACTLGSIVEFWPVDRIERFARECGMAYPARDYWTEAQDAFALRYQHQPRQAYTRSKMDGAPVDDDIVYTLLGLLTVETFGPDFTVEENAKSWLNYLPHACTAEDVALKNLKKGIPARKVGGIDNPFCEWLGADIRADPFGYMAPGWPERAASMAYRDAYLSHRRQGIYGEMFFAAAISAAFVVKEPLEAIRIGLTEIPAECALAQAVQWALKTVPRIKNYKDARKAVDDRFKGMSGVHTINNACLTIFGLSIGGLDFSKVAGETVAMGLDNDCTAATAGSIVGAIVGKKGIPAHWTRPFRNKIHSYLIGKPVFKIDDVARRFEHQAGRVWSDDNKCLINY